MQRNSKLSIGIPTFNRPEAVLRRIAELSRLKDSFFELVICDNSDKTDAKLMQVVEAHDWIKYSRNSANIGGGANFLRVVECATGDYLWWRGDDDIITDEQVAAACAATSQELQLVFLNHRATKEVRMQGVEEFAGSFPCVSSMGWLSMIVLPLDAAKAALPFGYWGIQTGWANVCLVLGIFRQKPNMAFAVVPFVLSDGEFREGGRNASSWAFFTTCIENFPRTAQLLPNRHLQRNVLAGLEMFAKF